MLAVCVCPARSGFAIYLFDHPCRGLRVIGPTTSSTPAEGRLLPLGLLQLRQLLRAFPQRQHPRCAGEKRQQLPPGLLHLRQLLREQPQQQPPGHPQTGQLLPPWLVQLRQLLRAEPLINKSQRVGLGVYSSSAPAGISLICLRPSLISNSSPGSSPSNAV
jgi:hypothetical protein